MTTSFYNGITGLKSFQYGIDIWGNNIANINTIGYKEQIPEFSTLFSDTILQSAVCSDIQQGTKLSSSSIDLKEGSLIHTDNIFDLALGSAGWFAVSNDKGTFYTKTGSFKRDANGSLVDNNGNYLLVANADNLIKNPDGTYILDRNINTNNLLNKTTKMSPIKLPNEVVLPAVATSEIKFSTNLNNSYRITSTSPAIESSDFSALYSKDGEDLQIRKGNSLVFGFGNPATYENNLISTEICIKDEEKDSQDSVYNFTLNGKTFNIKIPDGSSAEDIKKILKNNLSNAGILCEITNNGIKISDPKQIVLQSSTKEIPNIAAAKISYEPDNPTSYQFSTIKDFDNILQNLADSAFADSLNVYVDENGRICINNNSLKTINAYMLKTENSNDKFLENLGKLGNEIFPSTSAKSFSFLQNSSSFGGIIIDNDGNKDSLTLNFTKQKTLENQILWKADLTIKDKNSETLYTDNFDILFDSKGHIVYPKTVTIDKPWKMTLNLNLTSYTKPESSIAYSYSQNGIQEGYLKDYQINSDGLIRIIFSNGEMATLGQIPVFHFQNDQGLENIGNNLFAQSDNSGEAFFYKDTNGNYIPGSSILSNTLEESNVNFSQAMTELIITQKAFSSAAKTVTTSDQMIQRAINMKKG